MDSRENIIKQKQCIARCEKSLALEKIKKRRADTRRKIELGGLVIKAGMDKYNKELILGGLWYIKDLFENDKICKEICRDIGVWLFLDMNIAR